MRELLRTCCGLVLFSVNACVSPPPRSYVEADTLPSDFVGRECRAFAIGDRLFIEVVQIPGLNVVGFDTIEHTGALYVSPRRISSGGGGTAQFEVDLTQHDLVTDWPRNVYWLLKSYSYPIGNPGFWSSEQRSPWLRMKMAIEPR